MEFGLLENHVDVDGLTIHYLRDGEGPPMLLLHGPGMSSRTWLQNIESLSKFFSLYAPDLPSLRNYSTSSPSNVSVEKNSEILYRFILALEIERAHVVGFSSGGVLADLLSLLHPERVHRLVLISGLGLREGFSSNRPSPDHQSLMRRPVLIITGESDQSVRCEAVCYVVARNPLAKWVVIPGGHYLIHEEYPEEVNRHIISYCIETPIHQFCG